MVWAAVAAPAEVDVAQIKLPIVVEGATVMSEGRRRKRDRGRPAISREINLPTRGSWFVWVKASNPGWEPSVVTCDLDGVQPLRSSRARLMVPPGAKSQWLTYTQYAREPGYKMQVNVDTPGKHTVNVKVLSGRARVEKIALTLFFAATPSKDGKSLDHTDDPGEGRASFPETGPRVDGFRDDAPSPAIKAARTFYVDSEKGDDAGDGRSEAKAWKTFAKVNGNEFAPGDAILLKRGGKWEQGLAPKGSGTKATPVTIGAYGKGARPLVNGLGAPGVFLLGASWWTIQDLAVTSDPDAGNETDGIRIWSGAGPQPKGIRIVNCASFDNSGSGIAVGAGKEEVNGYDGVAIENCLSFANSHDGICVHGIDQNGCRNTVIRNCTAYANDGMAGIWIMCGQNALIENCVSYNNAVYNIWTWNAINITIRRCEAFRGRQPGAPADSGGFDIDWGSEACTVEYCYSHHNKGSGFLLMGSGVDQYRGFPKASRYNICRYNVSDGDMHGINVYNTFEYGKVYQNVVIGHRSDRYAPVTIWGLVGDEATRTAKCIATQTEFRNNIIVGLGDAVPVAFDEVSRDAGIVFEGNLYWRAKGKKAIVQWGKEALTKPRDANGIVADPKFKAVGRSGTGRLPLDEVRLASGSPARGAAKPVLLDAGWLAERRKFLTDTGAAEYGIPMEPGDPATDWWGDPLDPAKVSIGVER